MACFDGFLQRLYMKYCNTSVAYNFMLHYEDADYNYIKVMLAMRRQTSMLQSEFCEVDL